MRVLNFGLFILGVLAVLMGLLWIGQGTGLVPWPKQSFMINEMPWAYRRIGLAIGGLFILLISRRSKG
ncbi:MAG: hypothetical protein WAW96_11150 [Alphaproteobacteria bacterium]